MYIPPVQVLGCQTLLIVVIGSDDFSGISLSDSSTSSGGLIIHEVPSIQGTLHMCKSLILM